MSTKAVDYSSCVLISPPYRYSHRVLTTFHFHFATILCEPQLRMCCSVCYLSSVCTFSLYWRYDRGFFPRWLWPVMESVCPPSRWAIHPRPPASTPANPRWPSEGRYILT